MRGGGNTNQWVTATVKEPGETRTGDTNTPDRAD